MLRAAGTGTDPGTAPVTSTVATVAPVDPPAQRSCLPNPTDSPKDAHEAKMQAAARYFCSTYGKETAAKEAPNVQHRVWGTDGYAARGGGFPIGQDYNSGDNNDDVYDVGIKGVDGCVPQGGYNLAEPLKDVKCSDMVSKAWRECESSRSTFISFRQFFANSGIKAAIIKAAVVITLLDA